MRALFLVAVKIYGAMSIFEGISHLLAAAGLAQAGADFAYVFPSLIGAAVNAVIVYVAAAHAERLANLLGINSTEAMRPEGIPPAGILQVGLVLVGANQFLRSSAPFIRALSAEASIAQNAGAVVQVILSLALIFSAKKLTTALEDAA